MKKAFTLAEVLITLGIIGVVAAMTLPSLLQNYQKQVYVNALKKTISTLENGFKFALAEDEVDELKNTTLFNVLGNGFYGGGYNFDSPPCKNFEENLKKYFNIGYINTYSPTTSSYTTLNGGEFLKEKKEIVFVDGSSLVFFEPAGYPGILHPTSIDATKFYVDINSRAKRPNQLGRDLFLLGLSSHGHVLAVKTIYDNEECNKDKNGYDCFGYLQKNNYSMDY